LQSKSKTLYSNTLSSDKFIINVTAKEIKDTVHQKNCRFRFRAIIKIWA